MTLNHKNIVILYLLHFVVLPLGFLIRFLYSRTLPPEDFGLIYAIIAFFGVVSTFVNIGFSGALMYFVPSLEVQKKTKDIRNIFYYSFFTQLFLVSILTIGTILLTSYFAESYFKSIFAKELLYLFLIYFIFINLINALIPMLVAYKMNIYYQSAYIIQMATIFIISYAVYISDALKKISWYSLSWGIGVAIPFFFYAVVLLYKFPFLRSLPNINKKLMKKFFAYSLHSFSYAIGMIALTNIDVLIITYFLSLTAVAFYSNALSLINTAVAAATVLAVFIIPVFSELREKKNYQEIRDILDIIYGIVLFLLLPASVILALFPEQIMTLIFGSQYVGSGQILATLSMFMILLIFSTFNSSILTGLGLVKNLTKIILPVAVLNIILNLVLVQRFDLLGVVSATILSWFLICFFSLAVISREVGFRLNYFRLVKNIGLVAIFVSIVLVLKHYQFISNYYIHSFFCVGVAGVAYVLLGYIFKVYTGTELLRLIPESHRAKVIHIYQKIL